MSAAVTYAEARAAAFTREMAQDERVIMVGGYLSLPFNPPDGLPEAFPDRVLFTPISETAVAGFAIGAAMAGLRPVVPFGTASFMFYAWGQVTNEAPNVRYLSGGRVSCAVVFHVMAGSRGAGGAQHEHTPQAMLMNVPGIKIFAPATPGDVDGLVTAALKDPDPVLIVDHVLLGGVEGVVPAAPDIAYPRADLLHSGDDVTIVAYSLMTHHALAAAKQLAAAGINAEVLNLRTLVPAPIEDLISSVERTKKVVLVDESRLAGSPVSYLGAILCERVPDARVAFVCSSDAPFPAARPLRDEILPSVAAITMATHRLVHTACSMH